MNVDKLRKMAGDVRIGGKGTVRRKKKAVHKTAGQDDKRLQNTLRRLGVNTIPGIEISRRCSPSGQDPAPAYISRCYICI